MVTTIDKIYKTVGKLYETVTSPSLFVTSGNWLVPMIDTDYKFVDITNLKIFEDTVYWNVQEPIKWNCQDFIMMIFDKEYRVDA